PGGQALLQEAIGLVLVEAGERVAQARRRRGALAALAGDRDGAGDVLRLGEGLAQRLDLGELELAVAALRAAGGAEAEAPLPRAQCVGTHAEHGGGGVRADDAHARVVERWPNLRKSRKKTCKRQDFARVMPRGAGTAGTSRAGRGCSGAGPPASGSSAGRRHPTSGAPCSARRPARARPPRWTA